MVHLLKKQIEFFEEMLIEVFQCISLSMAVPAKNGTYPTFQR